VNRTIHICMVGAGRVGKQHSRSITRHVPGAKVVALVDPVESMREETGEEFAIEARFSSLEEALDKVLRRGGHHHPHSHPSALVNAGCRSR
jgi:predicted dehydrogenase